MLWMHAFVPLPSNSIRWSLNRHLPLICRPYVDKNLILREPVQEWKIRTAQLNTINLEERKKRVSRI